MLHGALASKRSRTGWTQKSDGHQLFLFGLEEVVEALDFGVGELLDLFGGALFVVGGDELVLGSFLDGSLPSRRMLRMEVLWPSRTPARFLTASLRRSSFMGGMGTRMMRPSCMGLKPW